MNLETFIDRVLTENNKLNCKVSDVENYICNKARKVAGSKSFIHVDDDVVKKWILEFEPKTKGKQEVQEKDVPVTQEPKKEIKHEYLEVSRKKVKKVQDEGEWGKQERLF